MSQEINSRWLRCVPAKNTQRFRWVWELRRKVVRGGRTKDGKQMYFYMFGSTHIKPVDSSLISKNIYFFEVKSITIYPTNLLSYYKEVKTQFCKENDLDNVHEIAELISITCVHELVHALADNQRAWLHEEFDHNDYNVIMAIMHGDFARTRFLRDAKTVAENETTYDPIVFIAMELERMNYYLTVIDANEDGTYTKVDIAKEIMELSQV